MPSPLADVAAEGERIVGAAAERGLTVRLCGGAAVSHLCPSARRPPLARPYKDVDLVGLRREQRPLSALLVEIGYAAREEFNLLNAGARLLFWDDANDRQLDVLLDRFEMCHALELADRLLHGAVALDPADLLLTKLQVRETNERDVQDALALLLDTDPDVGRVADVLCADWGWWRTATEVLGRVVAAAAQLPGDDAAGVQTWVARLESELVRRPRGLRWRARAAIGERLRWYEEPDDAY